MPTSVFFPEQNFNASIHSSVKEFNFDAMILVALNRYYQQLIFFEICDIPFNLKQRYVYRFCDFEIRSLGRHESFIREKEIHAPFNFVLSLYKKKYEGITHINIKFKNGGILEKSFYVIDINTETCMDLHIQPFFLTDNGFISHIAEFMQKMWLSVFCKLHNIEECRKSESHNYNLSELLVLPFEKDFKYKNIPIFLQDIIKDTYNISVSLIFEYVQKNEYIKLSADDFLKLRGLKKNKNSNGLENGYKEHERQKIHSALFILNLSKNLIVREVSQYNYLIKLPFKKQFQQPKHMPVQLICFSYKNELWQKRLGYYLCENSSKSIKVNDLYTEIKDFCSSFKPGQIRDKFELAMDNLVEKKVILDWHYKKIDENRLQGKGWFNLWLTTGIICRYYRQPVF